MTADRRADRRLARVQHASPYSQKTRNARQSQPKKSSGWSLAGFLSYFNPLRSRHPEEPEEETEAETSQDELDTDTTQPSQSSHDVFGSRIQPAQPPPPPPPAARPPNFFTNGPSPPAGPSSPQPTSLPEPSASPLKNVDAVKTYLEQSGGRPLNQVEIAGLVSMLQDSIDSADDDTQPFRFSKSPSRAASPTVGPLFPAASSSASTTTPKTPTKTLSKNPNGIYKWQGAGSARRNRYHSPAFGSPSSGAKIKLPPAETAKTDSKRRRVGQDPETSSPQKTSVSRQSSAEPTTAGPSTSSTGAPNVKEKGANGPQSKPPVNGINTSTSRLNKATIPTVSSPLRQAWGQDDIPSPNSSPTSAPKQSRAAAFITELIREATPVKKPDIANPYQTASPVKTVNPPVKKPVRKPRAVSKQPSTEEKPEMSMQAIIEATLPKGSKRSRPPAHLSASTNGSSEANSVDFPSQSPSPPPRQSSFPSFQNGSSTALNGSKAATIEEVEDEDELPSPKKQKKGPVPAEPMIIEIEDHPPFSQSSQFLRPSEVIEPGETPQLQTAGLNGASSSAPMISPTAGGRSFFGLKSSAPKEPSKLRFSIKADRDETASSASVSPTAATSPKDAKAEVLSITMSELPTETFTIPRRTFREGKSSGELRAEKEVRGFVDDDIPIDNAWDLSSTSPGPSNSNKAAPSTSVNTPATSTFTVFPNPSTNTAPTTNGGFNWGAAGLKPPSKQEDGWKCGTCDLMNLASATEKCTVCDTPKPGAEKTSATPSFSMPNPPSAPLVFGPGSTSTTTSAISGPGGFNWGAAGLIPPTTTTEGWKCGTCSLMNPASAKEKCTVCDAPKPGVSSSGSSSGNVFSMPAPPSGPLSFGTSNPTSSTPTTSGFSFVAPKLGGSTSNPVFTGFDPAPSTTTTTTPGGFNWGAAGLRPPSESGGWKCKTCDLMNLESATEKCTVCDTPKL